MVRLLTESAKQSQAGWVGSGDWTEVEVSFNLAFRRHLSF
ncbi:hypothetical protein Acr_06g0000050 [Actinidia rufa]|uniref:Uncharacterized protein n=1 Tax=Actinidia rufa TaxID=165716 RepID=A0A7J0ENI9_9ERIC|nr:hypothetical protein Acr_06g0000050 [Actinidia rufa]